MLTIWILKRQEYARYLPLLVLAVAVIILGVISPGIISTRNLINVLQQSSALALMAIGITMVMVTGGIDLSIPSVMAVGGILGAMFMRGGGNPTLGGAIMVIICSFLGMLNGFAVAYLEMVPFVVTLSMMYIATGISIWLTREVSIGNLPPQFIGNLMARFLGIPVPVIIMLLLAFLTFVFMKKSLYGRWLYAVGSHPEAARLCGIPVQKMIFWAYGFSGFFAGLAAIITVARLASASSTMGGEGIVLNMVGSAVVGGVSIYGAEGNALGAVVGAIFVTLIENIMNMMGVSYYMSLVAKGILIVSVVAFDSWRRKIPGGR
ncbi:MAG: ABC transporter permease [Candidatus Caldatribacteriaceae bacterium]